MLFGGVICFAGWVRFFLFFVASGALLIWKAGNAKANVKKCVGNFACITDGLHAKYAENGLFRAFGACFWRVFSVLHTHPPPVTVDGCDRPPSPEFFLFFLRSSFPVVFCCFVCFRLSAVCFSEFYSVSCSQKSCFWAFFSRLTASNLRLV